MTRRTRSILLDGNLSRMFAGISNSTNATPDKIIAGSKPLTSITYIKPKSSPLTVVTATKGTRFASAGMISSITYTFDSKSPTTASPNGRAVIVRLRKVSSNGTSTNIANYSLPVNVNSGTITTDTISIVAGDSFFWDVIQIGTSRPGSGLFITKTYYLTT